ncbi:hypothetical protein Clacol_010293 [Clathrus columnatus]|uniref:Uncharacterized protein n=1 Tax=Clathrus columnatus TaxID=1419009 RepID=A0AAV5ATC9_9AGAM|nr:hypothetical protein Clacol_010293 [Clathrus columnatus]
MLPAVRKAFTIIAEHDDPKEYTTTEAEDSEACSPSQRLQVDEVDPQERKKQVLRARLKELQEVNVRINKDDRAELFNTDADSDLDEHEDTGDEAEMAEPAPRPRRRDRFTSAVNRKKHCPYCKKLIMRRPAPKYRLREASETLGNDLSPLKNARSAHRCRNDLLHGIFHPENGDSGHLGPEYLVEAGDAEEVMARREIEEGRRRGILETRQRWERAEEAGRIAMARPITMHELRFGRGNPFRARHAPLVAIAVPRPAALPIPQVPEAPPGQI